MRIRNLQIDNLRGINHAEMTGLEDTVVVAGQNGCGKSCLFDAIRLIKSSHGGYQSNELMSFWSEFQIDPNIPRSFSRLFRDSSRSMFVEIDFVLNNGERQYISENLEELARSSFADQPQYLQQESLASRIRAEQALELDSFISKARDSLSESFLLKGKIELDSNGTVRLEDNPLLELVFGNYEPDHLGIIDYHGAQRHFQREQLGGVNLNLDSKNNAMRQHALYNYSSKYSNIKSEIAGAYIRSILIQKAGGQLPVDSLTETLGELFTTFFPGKSFQGPEAAPDGGLDFLVRLLDGTTHDINELSSGEKEVLFGYLRLRNSSPKYSIILIDEPELHLNPRLVRNLPLFYHRHLGIELESQLWLVTHSDALLREAVGKPRFSVFHMQVPDAAQHNQITEVSVKNDLEMTIVDMVGDLATYKPYGKILVCEGSDPEFDVRMITALFPELADDANLISGGNKSTVKKLRKLLERASGAELSPPKFFSIVDRDGQSQESNQLLESERELTWDVYHIENYLIVPKFIREALSAFSFSDSVMSEDEVEAELRAIASEILDEMVRKDLEHIVYQRLRECIRIDARSRLDDLPDSLSKAVNESLSRLIEKQSSELSITNLTSLYSEKRLLLEQSIEDGSWKGKFSGRDILRRFANKHTQAIGKYENFRNLIIDKMKVAEYRPEGMNRILSKIIEA
jgi:predicted ATPase